MSIAIMLTFVYKDKNLFSNEKGINNRDYRAGWCLSGKVSSSFIAFLGAIFNILTNLFFN